jgi:hypothetical protein
MDYTDKFLTNNSGKRISLSSKYLHNSLSCLPRNQCQNKWIRLPFLKAKLRFGSNHTVNHLYRSLKETQGFCERSQANNHKKKKENKDLTYCT